jgi:peptidoglycan/LPS O-acetylase OafA/YrhL
MPTAAPRRLHFLDGLRGAACLYVLFFHEATIAPPPGSQLSPGMGFFCQWFGRGHFSVVVFIVLSGFSLMLPIARAGSDELIGRFGDYLRRRAKRILPPYYAALVVSIALLVAYNAMTRRQGGRTNDVALSRGSVLSHFLLVHNLNFDWAFRINGPLWSVATEWQIYFLFPLLLLPLARRAGISVMLAVAWVLGSLSFFLLPAAENLFWACPWFLGSFAMGMAGAAIGFSPRFAGSWWKTRAPWGLFTWISFAMVVALVATGRADDWPYPVVHFVVTLFAFCLINVCVARSARGQESSSLLLRFFGSRTLVYVGGFSYSLYLVQHPVLRLTEKIVAKFAHTADAMVAIHLALITPVVVGVAWIFSELFERPFTSGGILLPAITRRPSREARPVPHPQP